MLEKNKDYTEMRVSSIDFAFVQNEPVHLCVEGLVDATNGRVPGPGEDCIIIYKEKFEALQTENEQLKKKLEDFSQVPGYREFLTALYPEEDVERLVWATEQICCGQVSVNGWEESAKFWKKRYDDIFKLVGFSSKEEVEDYLVNEAECDTLHEDILKLHDEVKYANDKWAKTVLKLNECENDYRLKVDKSMLLEQEIKIYTKALQNWKEGTGCSSPSAAKDLIESGASWHHAYNEIKKANEKLVDDVKSWRNVTGYSTPESCLSDRINNTCKIQKWKEATGCSTPEEAKEFIDNKKRRINELNDELDASQSALEEAHDRTTEMEDLCMEYRERIQSLYKVIKGWKEITGCSTLEEAKNWVNELGEANGNLALVVNTWQEVTGFKTPEEAKNYWTTKLSESGEVSESFAREVISWRKATGCKTPDEVKSAIRYYKARLGNAVQSASIATRILGNAVQSEANAMKVLDTIGYTDPIKED